MGNVVKTPVGLMRPMTIAGPVVNQGFPSGPMANSTIHSGVRGKVVTVPSMWMRQTHPSDLLWNQR